MLVTMMHGRSKMGTALTSNMATRERCRYRALVPRLSFFYFILFYLFFTESCRLNSVSTELERIGWWLKLTEMAETNRNGRNRPWFMHCTSKKLKPKPYRWVETHDWIQRDGHIHQHHWNPQQHNYYVFFFLNPSFKKVMVHLGWTQWVLLGTSKHWPVILPLPGAGGSTATLLACDKWIAI